MGIIILIHVIIDVIENELVLIQAIVLINVTERRITTATVWVVFIADDGGR
jgi:hypothetical protein